MIISLRDRKQKKSCQRAQKPGSQCPDPFPCLHNLTPPSRPQNPLPTRPLPLNPTPIPPRKNHSVGYAREPVLRLSVFLHLHPSIPTHPSPIHFLLIFRFPSPLFSGPFVPSPHSDYYPRELQTGSLYSILNESKPWTTHSPRLLHIH